MQPEYQVVYGSQWMVVLPGLRLMQTLITYSFPALRKHPMVIFMREQVKALMRKLFQGLTKWVIQVDLWEPVSINLLMGNRLVCLLQQNQHLMILPAIGHL